MRILLIYLKNSRYDSQIVRDYPCGGTEKAAIFLGEAFQKLGHDVFWVTTPDELEGSVSLQPDVVITEFANYLEIFPNAYKVWWVHLFSEQSIIQNHKDAALRFAHQTVTLSQRHFEDIREHVGIPSTLIRNGLWLNEIHPPVTKDPYKFIYCSSPDRGLQLIPKLFPLIQTRVPQANITICSSMKLYNKPEADESFASLYRDLMAMPGVRLAGAVNQAELYREMASSRYFFYPCMENETYCIALDEALAHGCLPLILEVGSQSAIPERVKTFQIQELEALLEEVASGPSAELQRFIPPVDWMTVAAVWEEKVFSSIAETKRSEK